MGNWVRYGRKGDSSKWEGQNALGRVLMQLRKDLWRKEVIGYGEGLEVIINVG